MKRFLVIFAMCVVSIGVVIAIAGVTVASTPWGRDFLIGVAEQRIGAALGGEAKIGALEGALPREVILRDVALSDGDDPWLTVERIEIRWRPFSLLGKKVDIESLKIEKAALLREPPSKEQKENSPLQGFEIPTRLPSVSVDVFEFSELVVAKSLAGVALRLDGAGALKIGGREIKLRLSASSENDSDTIDIFIDREPISNRLVADVTVQSNEHGVISALTRLDGPFFLEATTDSPVSNLDVDINAQFGAYGSVDGRIRGDLDHAQTIAASGQWAIGDKLKVASEELGPVARFNVSLTAQNNGAIFEIGKIETAAGSLSGSAAWENRRDMLRSASAEFEIVLAGGYREEIQRLLGGRAKIAAAIDAVADGYSITATIDTPLANLALADAQSDLERTVAGPVTVSLLASEALPAPFHSGATLSGDLDLSLNQTAVLSRLTLTLAENGGFDGDAEYDFESKAIDIAGAVRLTPSFFAVLSPDISVTRPVTGQIDLTGRFDQFTAIIDIDTPIINVNDAGIPAATIEASLAGLPNLPSGEISARARDGAGRLNISLRSAQSGQISVPSISFTSQRFNLQGSGSFDPKAQAGTIDLDYRGDAGARPWPGLLLSGDLTAKGLLGRNSEKNTLSLSSRSLRSDDFDFSGLEVTAIGPARALAIDLKAGTINAPGIGPITTLEAAAIANIGSDAMVTLNAFSANIATTPIKLRSPLTLSFDNGFRFDGLDLAMGRGGLISGKGAFHSNRWNAEINTEKAVIPGASAALTLDLDLDTDRKTPAMGSFVVRSLLTQTADGALSGNFAWDASALKITNTEDGDALDINVSIPLRLVRSPALSVATEGKLSGSARYAGRLEPLAAFLPSTLQTLEGVLTANAKFSGTISNPVFRGRVDISEAAYTEPLTGLSIVDIAAAATADVTGGDTKIIFTAVARGPAQSRQTISANGELTLGGNARLQSEIQLDGARLAAGPVSSMTASGEITLAGALDTLAASGTITIDELNAETFIPENTGLVAIEVLKKNGNGEMEPREIETATAPTIGFQIEVTANDQIFVRGRGLESEWDANIRVTGDAKTPLVLGRLNKRRGWIDFSGRRFDLTRGQITFDRLTPNDPVLDLRAEYETGEGVVATIVITGRGSEPRVRMVSIPSLPQDDIMALVLFGKPANELSAFETLQIAEALAQLGAIGPFGGGSGITGAARHALGLDLLSLDLGNDGASKLTIGKYVADGLFVSASQDVRGENGSVTVEYDITKSITVETELKQNGDQTVSANWKRDF